MPGKSKFQISRSLDERIKRILTGSDEFESEYSQVTSAFILGFNYGNITNCVGLTTNYELRHAVFPVVGLVFFKICPSDEEIKSSLESIREFSSSPNGLGSFKSDKNEHLFLIYSVEKGCNEVDKRIFNFSKGSFVRRRRLRLNILDDPFCPRQVHRGCEDFFTIGDSDSYSSVDDDHVDHLIFFIHGVGGVCDVRFRSCVEVVAEFKKMANSMLDQCSIPSSGTSTPSNKDLANHLKKGFFRKQSSDSGNNPSGEFSENKVERAPRSRRIECLPISWHSCTRKQTGMNDQLSIIALESVPKLRHLLNKVVMDALLYTSGPVYSQAIINNVGDEINRLYTIFMEKHPNFTGSVSLAGHSLGSVIIFDLLAHQLTDDDANHNSPEHLTNIPNNLSTVDEDIWGNNNSLNSNHKLAEARDNFSLTRKGCSNVSHSHNLLTSTNSEDCSEYKNLEELLKDMDLSKFAGLFHKEHIDLKTLLLLTDIDMKELNLPIGARRKLRTYINYKKVSMLCRASLRTKNTQQEELPQSKSEIGSCDESEKINKLLDKMNTGQYLVKYPQLKFKPRCFFAFGSPMTLFLSVRGMHNISENYKLPTCDRMLNIFHPYDPLAYRIEPMIDPRFKGVEPVLLPHHRGGKRIHVQLREGIARVGHDFKHKFLVSLKDTWTSFRRVDAPEPEPTRSPSVDLSFETKRRYTENASLVDMEVESVADISGGSHSVNLSDAHAIDLNKIGKLNEGRRIDYVLQEKPIELFNEYIFAFTSHASYWQNEDSALKMLNEIYQVDNIRLFDNYE